MMSPARSPNTDIMTEQHLTALHVFIVQAKRACYVGDGHKLLPYRLASHDLQYAEGPWVYHDSYLAERDFIGQEIVYADSKPVWGMNYYGCILKPELISSAQAGSIIKESLAAMYAENRFLGGFRHQTQGMQYVDTSSGDFCGFAGIEWIVCSGQRVYELHYHGGLLRA
ncbi:DUF5680 domain-containing protein [Uliginosibacterium gangwonense]|uniref:DUF5680 domain-containing protein n=1 Tax=Uliginosibacterium gangwonense TaxID=392736 RepID=UPI00035FE1A0|nr:DUF5680 domain-containing protein [Uliginosibacterium gangwonense]